MFQGAVVDLADNECCFRGLLWILLIMTVFQGAVVDLADNECCFRGLLWILLIMSVVSGGCSGSC